MRIGGSLLLIAVGAILNWAVSAHVNGVNLHAVGWILMIVGAVGLALTLIWMSTRRRTDVIYRDPAGVRGATYVAPHDPMDAPY